MRNEAGRWRRALILGALLLAACAQSEPEDEPLSEDEPQAAEDVIVQDRFTVTRSEFGPEGTLSRLLETLDRRELTVFAVIDHAAAAQSVGAALPFATLVIFGDPETATPLIEAVPLMGAELPLRALVYTRGEATYIAMTGTSNLSRTYPLSDEDPLLGRIGRLVAEIADEVTRA
ncbi:DUF302 domain-containing protein [Parvularcula dongshanensis]|uniref:Uncharacterized protein (DUF302 family) n=1 Tax=Parvularcula dongshanensis TaxID=1173995 RepID=A0A840I3R1_9PROT|nr:DUF302 domain-containing protein [Parvularcula dongshanensis]MBB4658680.1 uncharacterized protein (DUF302 family) [Parvularcula dongshanensis]